MRNLTFACAATSTLGLACGTLAASVVVDQVGATFANGGYNPAVVQSFTPAANILAGASVRVHGTGALTANVTISLYADAGLTQLLRTGTTPNVPRDTMGLVAWEPVAVVPEQLYYLRFDLDSALTIGSFVSNSTDAYTRGQIVAVGGGNMAFTYRDAVFVTYSAVPEPAGGAAVAAGLLVLARRRR